MTRTTQAGVPGKGRVDSLGAAAQAFAFGAAMLLQHALRGVWGETGSMLAALLVIVVGALALRALLTAWLTAWARSRAAKGLAWPTHRHARATAIALGVAAAGLVAFAIVREAVLGIEEYNAARMHLLAAAGFVLALALAARAFAPEATRRVAVQTVAGLPVRPDGTVGKTPDEAVARR